MQKVNLIDEILQFAIPGDWEEWDPPDELIYLASSPIKNKPFEPQLTISHETVESGTSATEYFVANYPLLEATMPHFREHESREFTNQGTDLLRCEYSAEVEGIPVTTIDYYVVIGTDAYLFHCKCPSADIEQWRSVFQRIGDSIVCRNQDTPDD